ncbi:MAG: O-antigen ligase family protein, partial [Clostridia bacterium]|nr:O-antigen ligase family protein [Clostridia bacterium]
RKTYVHTIIIISALLLTALVITVVLYGFGELLVAVKPFFSDSSRTKLYEEALNLFAKYPLFGSGLGYVESDTVSALSISLYNFHSVFFHVLATMGIVGIVAYIFYYIARFKILMKNYNCFSLFATIAFLMFECYAFIDTAEFNVIPLMSTVTVFITIVELTNKKSNDEPLPLTINYYNKIIF